MLSGPDFCGFDDIQIIAEIHTHTQQMHKNKHLVCFELATTGLSRTLTHTHRNTDAYTKA